MFKYSNSTPCPVTSASPLESSTFQLCDPTEQVNFTTQIQAALRQTAPKRRRSIRPQAHAGNIIPKSAANGRIAGATPVQTVNDCNAFDGQPILQQSRITGLGLPRRRASVLPPKLVELSVNSANVPQNVQDVSMEKCATQIRKKPRRRTIYIPSDDTTILTIHPGMHHNTRAVNDYTCNSFEQTTVTGMEVQHRGELQQQKNRMPLAAAPKRVPLQSTLRPLQELVEKPAIPGGGPGKENLPPGTTTVFNPNADNVTASKPRTASISGTTPESKLVASDDLFRFDGVSAMDQKKPQDAKKKQSLAGGSRSFTHSSEDPAVKKKQRNSIMKKRNTLYYGSVWNAPVESLPSQFTARLPSKLAVPLVAKESIVAKERYPVLAEDIDRPEMFEDAWLGNQEAAIQQLINDFFEIAHKNNSIEKNCQANHRGPLLRLYQSPHCSILYKRLQASLLYGALSPPEGSIGGSSRLRNDIGLRQKLLAIWMATYDPVLLSAAAEVVIGRGLSRPPTYLSHEYRPASAMTNVKKELELFLVSCLIHNEDADESDQQFSAFCWRRTVLRSLMLVLLLDMAAQAKLVQGNLFRTSSKLKSSRSVLTELSALLLPFVGDLHRPLSQLGYHLCFTQFPLSEYEYIIRNLATDLRDGVQLTRLVELLLYPPQTLERLEENLIIAMPAGEVLTSIVDEGQSWVLSQHLKFPCISRAQKVYNLQIALSALRGIRGVGQIAETLSAEDIVDGHRERTVALLWALVGKWGLDSLVDFEALVEEIQRLEKSRDFGQAANNKLSNIDEDDEWSLEGLERQMLLLKKWARAIGSRHGLQVLNLTTSFADGKVFGKIVDEYQPYLAQEKSSECVHIAGKSRQLHAKLKASIFEHNERGKVFDRDFTIAALAFLCSRLLGATKRGRAAAVIQRAYRQYQVRRTMRQRCALLKIAHDCKAVFDTRNSVIGAATTLQRAWRIYMQRKKDGTVTARRYLAPTANCGEAKELAQVEEDSIDIWLS